MPKEFGVRKLEATTKDGSDLGGEDEKNKLEELKAIIVVERRRRVHQEVTNGVKVTQNVVGAIQVGQNPRQVCLTEGVCLVARVNTGSAVQQQCSSAADKNPGKDTHTTLGPGLQDGSGWSVWIRQQIHGKHGSGAGC